MRLITQCPVCSSVQLHPFLSCRDYTVSHETFSLVRCPSCTLVITSPQPKPENLERYYQSDEYISHSTQTNSFFSAAYRIARQTNIRRKLRLISANTSTKPKRLLDFGTGTGEFLAAAQRRHISVAGVEPASKARHHANTLTNGAVTQRLDEQTGTFDAITLWHVLEHVPDLNEQFETLVARLEKNGTMFIAVPNHQSLDAKHYGVNWAAYDVPRHLWHFTQQSMAQFLKKHGMKITTIIPMKLDAFYVSLLSEKYLRGARNVSASIQAILNAWRSNRAAKKTNEYSSLIYVASK